MDAMLSLWTEDEITNTPAKRSRAPKVFTPKKLAAELPARDWHLLLCEVCRKSMVLKHQVLGQSFADQAEDAGWHEVPMRANTSLFRQWCPEHREIGQMVFEDQRLELAE